MCRKTYTSCRVRRALRDFSIGEVVADTGVAEGTLRMWEHRHGFPAPQRLESGHRRYSEGDVRSVRRIVALRQAGMSLALAIERAQAPVEMVLSVHAALRSAHPELNAQLLTKRALLALTHAIEDETVARAERSIMFGSFQRERYYRCEQAHWRELSRTAELCCVLADFEGLSEGSDGPIEIPVGREHPLAREWTLVCDAPGYGVCLSGWEPPRSTVSPPGERVFETAWSVQPLVVPTAARTCAAIARAAVPDRVQAIQDRLDERAPPPTEQQLRLASAITSRTLSYLV